jgi:hypothetical protein
MQLYTDDQVHAPGSHGVDGGIIRHRPPENASDHGRYRPHVNNCSSTDSSIKLTPTGALDLEVLAGDSARRRLRRGNLTVHKVRG